MLGGRALLSIVFCPVRDLCHVKFDDFRTKREDMRDGTALWCLVVVLFVLGVILNGSVAIPEGKKNPRSFLRSPSPPGEGSGRWWPWTFTMASRFGKSAVAPSLIKNTPLASAASLLSCACDRAALISCLIFHLTFHLIFVLCILNFPPSLGRFSARSAVSSSWMVVAATSSWSLVVGLI